MADVYNKYFKKPFDAQEHINPFENPEHPEYMKGGFIQPNLLPGALLPGAKVDLRNFIEMRLSFYPSSPEFDAVKWQIGNEASHPHKGETNPYVDPFIAADLDINNDGRIETVIKHEFMSCYDIDPRCHSGQADVLSIFRKGDIDLTKGGIELGAFFDGQNGKPPLAVICGPQSTCRLLRPFIYDGVTYLSCYWPKGHLDINDDTSVIVEEYTDVLKYQGVKKLPDGREPLKAETVCRFRMVVTK